MSLARQVLVVDRAEGSFAGVMEDLDLLGFRVVWVPTLRSALEFVNASPQLALCIASAAATDEGGEDFLARVKHLRPSLRIIWGVRSGAPPTNAGRGQGPDSIIAEPFRPDALRDAVSTLLTEHFYPQAIADAIQAAALEVLGTIDEFVIERRAFLVANQTTLCEFSAIIAFSGDASGHLLVSMTAENVRILHQRFLPGSGSIPIERLEDLVGELCNRILGRISAFFSQRDLSIQRTTPIFIRAAGNTTRYPGRHPSFGLQLRAGEMRLSLAYYLADFDRAGLQHGSSDGALRMGEILYL